MMKRCSTMLFCLLMAFAVHAQVDSGADCSYSFNGIDKQNFDKGVEAYRDHHFGEAKSLLRKVSSKHPKAADPYFYLGMIAVAENDNPGAIRRYFTKLIDVCPDYPNALAHFYRGIVYYTDEQFEDCIAEMNRYFEIANRQSIPEYLALYDEASSYLYWANFLSEAYQNPVPFNPTLLHGASSRRDEILPYITPNGQQIYYLRQVPQSKGYTIYAKTDEELEPRLCVSRWKDTAFTSGEELPYPFNQGDPEGGVSMTADGRCLYYSSAKRGGSFDIYFAENQGGKWGELQSAGINVNDKKAWDSQPAVSPDGKYLYFASNRKGGQGGTDIWYCHRLPNGDWSRAENLGPSVNTAGNEKCPFLCADGHTLFFASDGWQGFGGYDMFRIDLSDPYRLRPTNLGHPINTENEDSFFGVTTDGKHAYYAARGGNLPSLGGYDIYQFDLYPDARPEPMRCVPVQTAANARVLSLRPTAEAAEYWMDASGHGAMMLSCSENQTVMAVADGCVPDVVRINRSEVPRITFLTLSPLPAKANQHYPIKAVLFDSKNALTSDGKQVIDTYVTHLLQKQPRMHVRIECPVAAQAKAIYDYLTVEQKMRPERIEQRVNTGIIQPQIVITQM
ncbi:MAG: PD40 domain-containing protein [Bacteroidales bacterium]|nr:PD40 domain-containing protein [Bacteroidales bacterium]